VLFVILPTVFLAAPYFLCPLNPLNSADRANVLLRNEKGYPMNAEIIRNSNEIVIEIEELEEKIAPGSSATFLD
jgi:hypothetical protein